MPASVFQLQPAGSSQNRSVHGGAGQQSLATGPVSVVGSQKQQQQQPHQQQQQEQAGTAWSLLGKMYSSQVLAYMVAITDAKALVRRMHSMRPGETAPAKQRRQQQQLTCAGRNWWLSVPVQDRPCICLEKCSAWRCGRSSRALCSSGGSGRLACKHQQRCQPRHHQQRRTQQQRKALASHGSFRLPAFSRHPQRSKQQHSCQMCRAWSRRASAAGSHSPSRTVLGLSAVLLGTSTAPQQQKAGTCSRSAAMTRGSWAATPAHSSRLWCMY